MKKYAKTLAAALTALLALAGSIYAADTPVNLVQWTFNSASSFSTDSTSKVTTVTPISRVTGVAPTSITQKPQYSNTSSIGINNTSGINTFQRSAAGELRVSTSSYTNGGTNAANYNNFSLATALARDNYFEFTITADTDYDVTLNSISFSALADPKLTTSTIERGFWLLSSIGGFTADKVLLSGYSKGDDANSTLSASYTSFSNNSFSGTKLAAGSSVTFRFYVQTPGNSAYVYFDDIIVTGSVAATPSVPEPATLAVLFGALALVCACLMRRRRS